MKAGSSITIWFFVGLSMLVNGALILGAGLYALISPPEQRVVLYNLHADIWWGGFLFLAGAIYSWHFSPWRERARAMAREKKSPQ
jgi:hypothetical protein